MPRVDYPRKGDPITAEWACALVDAVNEALEGPKVVSPLAKLDGSIYFADHYQLFEARTTGTIPARVGGLWKSGDASFLTVDADGNESDTDGSPDFTAWNWTGIALPSDTRIWVAWAYEKWVILLYDCSGVA